MNSEFLKGQQLFKNLSKQIQRARQSTFYQSKLEDVREVKNYKMWSQIPLTTKSDLRKSYPFQMLATPMTEVASYHESSGTTGTPSASFFSEDDWMDIGQRFLRNAIDLKNSDVVLIKTPYSLITTAHQMQYAARSVGATIIPADNRSANMTYPKVVRLLKDLEVTVTWSLPSELIFWAICARKLGLDPAKDFPHLRGFLVAGEALSKKKQAFIEHLWGGKKLYQDYGSTETGSMAGQCSFGQLHLWNDRILFEVYDKQTGLSQLTGNGQLLVTPMNRQAMPLIRYNTEDEVEITGQPCNCGSNAPRVKVFGRCGSQFDLVNQAYFQSQIEEIVYSLPHSYEIVFWKGRVQNNSLQILIQCKTEFKDVVCDELAHEFFRKMNITANVSYNKNIVSESVYFDKKELQKPKYFFHQNECWENAITY